MDQAIEVKGGRFYIRMGYNGFNTRANNLSGYATEKKALAAAQRCGYRPGMGPFEPALRKEG